MIGGGSGCRTVLSSSSSEPGQGRRHAAREVHAREGLPVMPPALAVATAVTLVWLGRVLAISFLEAPLRFRAPQVSLRIGLGIGRLVFRA